MTREEAVKILDEVIPPPGHHTVDLEHLGIAEAWACIKETLTAEPFNCSLEEFGECSYRETGCSDCKVKEKVRNAIDNAEPIKHGRWKPFDLTWGRSVYACTSCGQAMEVPTEGDKPMYDYCPYCGADMRGGEDD